jgi:hypothetical protein
MYSTIHYTQHIAERQAQRNLSDADIAFVIERGRRFHCAGALHIFLGRRDIPPERAIYREFAHLEGTVLVAQFVGNTLVLITAYRNRNALKEIRTKAKYDRRK